jgi:nicotinate phosphoribosyltransferase
MPGGLRTDLYELNMAASYLRRGMDGSATFSLYVRDMPKQRGFLVAAGLDDCLGFLETFSFEEDDLAYLGRIGFEQRAIEDFAKVRFTGEVWAVPEGRIVHAKEPILEVTAPIAEAQLVETVLLNQVTLHTTITSKAARYIIAAEGRELVDFAFRRAHGVEAARAAARGSALVGFRATSNVEAAREFRLAVSGTMAHSFITAFEDEREAFRAFAEDHPNRTTFLVDTYDTLTGVRNAIDVIEEVGPPGEVGVRLDSGDLDRLSREARRLLDHAGLGRAKIFASGGLDEHEVAELVRAGAPVDAFGIGTQLGVSADAPYIDAVYKLVEFGGRPVLKLSPAKASAPGRKQVWRGPSEDVLGLRDEAAPGPNHEALLEPVMRAGRRLAAAPPIEEMRERFERDMKALPIKAARLNHPEHVVAHRTAALAALTVEATEEARSRGRSDGGR